MRSSKCFKGLDLSFIGGLLAYAIVIGIVGARQVRTLYQRRELAITRFCGVMNKA